MSVRSIKAVWFRFSEDRRGAFAIITALMLTVLIIVGGMAVDYSRAQMAKERLQFAVDSGALAVGQIFRSYEDPEAAVNDYVEANIDGSVIIPESLSVDTVITETPTSREVVIEANASVEGIFTAFYGLDKIDVTARTATAEAYEKLEVALVLDISSSMTGDKVAELREAAKAFVTTLLEEETDREFRHISIIPYGGTVKLGADFFDYLKPGYSEAKWNGCLEFDSSIMNDGLIPLGAHDPVQHIWRYKNHKNNEWCPPGASEPLFFSNDVTQLTTYIDNLTRLSDVTGADSGSAWGLKALSPLWRGRIDGAPSDTPADYGDSVKSLVIMTDGGITYQGRAASYDLLAAFGDDIDDPSDDHPTVDPVYADGSLYSKAQAQLNFTAVCDEAKAKAGIQVYTVGFAVSQTWMLDLLKDCATREANYMTPATGELEETFRAIALRLDSLKLVN
ncbi:MAG: pilus assembly protein TadG-related protein [Neomegalonema sp.]